MLREKSAAMLCNVQTFITVPNIVTKLSKFTQENFMANDQACEKGFQRGCEYCNLQLAFFQPCQYFSPRLDKLQFK